MQINPSVSTYSNVHTSSIKKSSAEVSFAIADEPKQASTTSSTNSPAVPVEAYAIPVWLKGYGRDITNEVAVGQSATYVDPNNIGFENASQEELAEFAELRQKHLYQLYENNGLLDIGSRFKATTSIEGLNERLHQQFNASVSSDSRMMTLMNKLGVNVL